MSSLAWPILISTSTPTRPIDQSNLLFFKALSYALLAPIPFSLTKMAAVQDQRKRCERWKEKFSKVKCFELAVTFSNVVQKP
jgi:hypothetical protein